MARRGENIYKRKDGRWEGRYIKTKGTNQKTMYGYIYAKTYKEVKERLSKAKAFQKNNSMIMNDSHTVAEVSQLWLNSIITHVKKSTYAKYRNVLFNHIIPSIGMYKMIDLNTKTVKDFATQKLLNEKFNDKGGLSPKTVKDILSELKLIIQYANANEILCNCNFDNIEIKTEKRNIKVLSGSAEKVV